jgi:hypothetical protein
MIIVIVKLKEEKRNGQIIKSIIAGRNRYDC